SLAHLEHRRHRRAAAWDRVARLAGGPGRPPFEMAPQSIALRLAERANDLRQKAGRSFMGRTSYCVGAIDAQSFTVRDSGLPVALSGHLRVGNDRERFGRHNVSRGDNGGWL